MREDIGDLWTYPAVLRVITTNGVIRRDGRAVMGKGNALQAKQRYANIDLELGDRLRLYGNHVHVLFDGIVSFPTKHHWRDKSDLTLINRSAHELVAVVDDLSTFAPQEVTVVLPRPGCGAGGLTWESVRSRLEPIFDDRFVVITYNQSQ